MQQNYCTPCDSVNMTRHIEQHVTLILERCETPLSTGARVAASDRPRREYPALQFTVPPSPFPCLTVQLLWPLRGFLSPRGASFEGGEVCESRRRRSYASVGVRGCNAVFVIHTESEFAQQKIR